MILQICITNVQPVQTALWRFDDGGLEVVRESDLDRVKSRPAILLPFPGDQEGLATHYEPRVSHAHTETYTPPSVLLILEHIAMSSATNVVVVPAADCSQDWILLVTLVWTPDVARSGDGDYVVLECATFGDQ